MSNVATEGEPDAAIGGVPGAVGGRVASARRQRAPLKRPLLGLTSAEAGQRLSAHGPNELMAEKARSPLELLFRTLREPLFLLLIAATLLYLSVGDLGEGLFMACSAMISIGLVVVQETRSERAIAALRALAQPSARVLRDGGVISIPSRDIVVADALVLRSGDRIAADAHLVDSPGITVDEAMLTGESVPVDKVATAMTDPAARAISPKRHGEGASSIYAGTIVTAGEGVAIVTGTGRHTQLGRIGELLVSVEPERPRLERAMGRAVLILSFLALAFCAGITAAYGFVRGDWLEGALAGITLAIALVPEEFPMVLSVFMTLGAWRLARRQVLTRHSAVIEALGAASVLCVDKTGTLTANDMTLVRAWTPSGGQHAMVIGDAQPDHIELLRTAGLACDMQGNDPMDRAVLALSDPGSGRQPSTTLLPTSAEPYLLQAWNGPGGVEVAMKGAPETILRLCRGGDDVVQRSLAETRRMAFDGLRVLAVAKRIYPKGFDVLDQELLGAEPPTLLGLIGFIDPVRSEVPDAVAQCRAAGIRVVMITGDYPATATAIARQAGIASSDRVLTGNDVECLSPDEMGRQLGGTNVFARIRPEQKLTIVRALQSGGAVVAMTGDGVNDAPALKAADIGIAMGLRGTDLARETADIVLLDDRFSSIVAAIAMGRRIFANLRRALVYITAIHVPIAGLAAMPIILGLPPMLLPMHVVLMEMVIDPLCSVAFEAEAGENGAMRRPPTPAGEPLFSWVQLLSGFLQGCLLLAVTAACYLLLLRHGHSDDHARSFAYVVLTFGNLVLALCTLEWSFSSDTWRNRRALLIVAAATTIAILSIIYLPILGGIFRTVPLSASDFMSAFLLAAVAGSGVALPLKLVRHLAHARSGSRHPVEATL